MVRPEDILELKYEAASQRVSVKIETGYAPKLVYTWLNTDEKLRQFKDLMVSLSKDADYGIVRGFLSYQGTPIKTINYKTGDTIRLTAL